jgi:hypothetical protein
MVVSASTLASCVSSTPSHTLITIFCAQEIRQSLRVLGSVGGQSITANAVIGEVDLVVAVSVCIHLDTGLELTGLQSFACVVADAPGNCKQSKGQAVICD